MLSKRLYFDYCLGSIKLLSFLRLSAKPRALAPCIPVCGQSGLEARQARKSFGFGGGQMAPRLVKGLKGPKQPKLAYLNVIMD
jgi:hypothetical protein